MPDVAYYRSEAKRCRDLAVAADDPYAALHWHEMADEYALLADELDAMAAGRASVLTTPAARKLREHYIRPKR
jgi:hypothetical protein